MKIYMSYRVIVLLGSYRVIVLLDWLGWGAEVLQGYLVGLEDAGVVRVGRVGRLDGAP